MSDHPKTDPDNPQPLPGQEPKETVNEEEPLGWDEAPQGEDTENNHRHPRQEGKGGTPDKTLPLDEAQGEGPNDPEGKRDA